MKHKNETYVFHTSFNFGIIGPMNIDRFVMAFAGFMILASLTLGLMVHPGWFFLTGFVGLNMFQASFTGFCPLAMILRKVGVKSGQAFS